MENLEDNKHTQLLEITNSNHSVSYYDSKTFRSVIPQIMVTAVLVLPNVTVGIIYGYSSILIPQLMEIQNSTDADVIQISKSESAWIISATMLSVPVGGIVGGILMDSIGRINLLKLMVLPCISGFVVIATAVNVPMLIIGRILNGVGLIWGLNTTSVYIAEVSRPDIRGSLSATSMLNLSIGMVVVVLKGWYLNWRTVAWLCNIYMIIFMVIVMFIPESPVWLVSKGRVEQAKKSLEWFNRYQPPIVHTNYKVTFSEMQLTTMQQEHLLKTKQEIKETTIIKKFKMFLQPTGYKPLLILSGIFLFQQFAGTHLLIVNGVIFFQKMGISTDPYLAAISIGSVRFVMSIVFTWLMKRYNKRTLMFVSSVGMAVTIALSGLFTKWIEEGTTTHRWIPVTLLMLYYVFATIGIIFVPIVLSSEIFPLSIRGICQSLSTCVAHILMFTVVQCYYILEEAFGGSSGLQYFFAVMCICQLIFSYTFMPETHNKKLSIIEQYFLNNTIYVSIPTCKQAKGVQKHHASCTVLNGINENSLK